MNFNWEYFFELFLKLPRYIPVTILIALLSMVVAVLLGAIMTWLQLSGNRWLRYFANAYVSLFRGMPTLVQLFLIFYGLPQLFPFFQGMTALSAAIGGLGLKQSAYLAEIFRAAVNSVDKGQVEAGKSLNIPNWKIFLHVILPQATLNALPATGNTFVSLLKETSLVFTLGITELFSHSKMLAGESLRYFETYLAVGLLYWIMIIIYTWLQHFIERDLAAPYRREGV
ncbi:amino acid ABC transporter permease [Streptococcus dentapri]|uniref:Amino acid ABC transporter permease n=1 Tax=Streptococcus dentapri TaxID=573564 RepID=A0ABV8D2S9_9STRE